MAVWKSYRVTDILNDIEDEKFVLPVIQRRLVWEEERMELLFDTLLKGDSFGGIMVIEEEKDSKPLFNYRVFTKEGDIVSSRPVSILPQLQYFVIDGQQRLQSFYIGLKGSIKGKVLFFDLYSDYNTEYEFRFLIDINDSHKQVRDKTNRPIMTHNWYQVSRLLKRLKDTNDEEQVSEEIIKAQEISENIQKTHIAKNVKAFYKNIFATESVGVSKVIINKSLGETFNKQRIVELFRRLNDGGTKLSPFDLVASKLKGFDWKMEGFLEEVLESYEDINLSQDNLIKLIFLLQGNHNKEMASIEEQDAAFAIEKRERFICTLKSLKDFLLNSKLYDYYKDGNRSFIPLFFIAYHLFHKNINNDELNVFFDDFDTRNAEFPRMKKWVYHSLLNGVFRSKGVGWVPYKTGIRKLLEVIQNFKSGDFPVAELFQVYQNHPIAFTTDYQTDNLDRLDASFLFYLIYDRDRITRIQDVDHIMPKSILERMGYSPSNINSIKNYQLLDYKTNRGDKNARPFKEWINNLEVFDKSAYVKRHLIPPNENIWLEDKFDDFIAARNQLILDKVKSYVE